MSAPPVPTDLLRITDLSPAQLEALLDLAATMKARPHGFVEALRGESVALYFEQPATRTRVSFAAAAERLGMAPIALRQDELRLGRDEPVSDTGLILSAYVAAIVARVFSHRLLEELAAAATVPVVNALSDDHHPCQALADLLTLRERFGELRGLKVAFVGAGNNVAHSLLEAGALAGMRVAVASPLGLGPRIEVLERVAWIADDTGAALTATDDPVAAVTAADAVYTDLWPSVGEEADIHERRGALASYQVDAALMTHAKPEAIFLHRLPAHRGEEVAAEVIDGPQSAVWQQAENRLPTEEAVLAVLAGRDWSIHATGPEPRAVVPH